MFWDKRRSPKATERRRKSSGGFSLVEALVAASFLGATMLAFTAASITLTRGSKTADSLSVATALARQAIEQLRTLPLGNPLHDPGSYNDPNNPIGADGGPGGPFTRTWTVSARDVPTIGLKTLTVTMAWNDPLPHTSQLATYIRCSEVPCP